MKNANTTLPNLTTIILAIATLIFAPSFAYAQTRIGDICHIKGQETNTLRGVGLVVGLQGTGDPNLATTGRMVAQALANSGMEIPRDANGNPVTDAYKDNKNASLVFVTATVPAAGAREGSKLDVEVMAWDKTSSLAGGMLLTTALTGGPIVSDVGQANSAGLAGRLPVFAMASGKIRLEGNVQTVGRVSKGAQLLHDFRNQFYEEVTDYVQTIDRDGNPATKEQVNRYLNLVLHHGHADFDTAANIAEQINSEITNLLGRQALAGGQDEVDYAHAIDSINIRVRFTEAYLNLPVEFARFVENIQVISRFRSDMVVINPRTMMVTIGRDVYFTPVAVASGDFKVDIDPFKELSLDQNQGVANDLLKLKELVDALNAIQAPPKTIIDVIKHLEEGGHLHGRVREL